MGRWLGQDPANGKETLYRLTVRGRTVSGRKPHHPGWLYSERRLSAAKRRAGAADPQAGEAGRPPRTRRLRRVVVPERATFALEGQIGFASWLGAAVEQGRCRVDRSGRMSDHVVHPARRPGAGVKE